MGWNFKYGKKLFQHTLQVRRLDGYSVTDLPAFKSEFSSGMDICANFLKSNNPIVYSTFNPKDDHQVLKNILV